MSEKDNGIRELDRTNYTRFKKSVEDLYEREKSSELLNSKITEKSTITSLKLSNRVTNMLYRAQIAFVSDILEYTVTDLKEIKNLGAIGVNEIQNKLASHGFMLKQ